MMARLMSPFSFRTYSVGPFETANEMKRHEKLIKEKKFWEDMIKEVEEVRV